MNFVFNFRVAGQRISHQKFKSLLSIFFSDQKTISLSNVTRLHAAPPTHTVQIRTAATMKTEKEKLFYEWKTHTKLLKQKENRRKIKRLVLIKLVQSI